MRELLVCAGKSHSEQALVSLARNELWRDVSTQDHGPIGDTSATHPRIHLTQTSSPSTTSDDANKISIERKILVDRKGL